MQGVLPAPAMILSLLSSSPGLQVEFINPIFEFSRAMNELQLNDAEFALLIAISIFSAGMVVVGGGEQRETEQETFAQEGFAQVGYSPYSG